jgi:hypothetical protein
MYEIIDVSLKLFLNNKNSCCHKDEDQVLYETQKVGVKVFPAHENKH